MINMVSDIFAPVEADFERANALILNQLHSRVPLVETIGKYIVESGGKRMRPLLVLLISRALQATSAAARRTESDDFSVGGERFPQRVGLATVIEFLHTATLLHDDVVDDSGMRRGRATANARWNNASSVLVGDFLYSRSFELMVTLGNLEVMAILAGATNVIAEGEVLQLTNIRNPNLSEADYRRVIHAKTAMLFQAAAQAAAVLAGASAAMQSELRDFGSDLGMAFQLIDDVLDYAGDAEKIGKNVGDDLAEGKVTLPLIEAMRRAPPDDVQIIRKAIRSGGVEDMSEVMRIVNETAALDHVRTLAQNYADAAEARLEGLADSAARRALRSLCHLAVSRDA